MKLSDIKEKLKTEFNYHLLSIDKEYANIHIYDMNNHYIGSSTLKNGRLSYNHKTYNDVVELVNIIKEDNNHREYIPEYYDPITRRMYCAQYVIDAYMKKLGFDIKYHSNYGKDIAVYTKNGMYNSTITLVEVAWDDPDAETGEVTRFITDFSWVDGGKFTTPAGCIAKINAIIESDLLINASYAINVLQSLSEIRDYDALTIKKIDTSNLQTTTYIEYKETIKELLKDALKKLE